MKINSIPRSSFKVLAILGLASALTVALLPGSANAVETPLNMGVASTYGVLAYSAITNATPSAVSGTAGGDVGYGTHSAAPTGTITHTGSLIDSGTADAALAAGSAALAESRTYTDPGVELGSQSLVAGAYQHTTLQITGTLTLNGQGDANAVFIFRSAATLITAAASSVVLTNGAQACNVYWQLGSAATLGDTSTIAGHVIATSAITTGSSTIVRGQLIALNGAVKLGGTTIVNDACVTPVVTTAAVATTPPAPYVPIVPGTLKIIKVVKNLNSGTATASNFQIRISQGGTSLYGTPESGVEGVGRTYVVAPGTYLLSEDPTIGYRGEWSGPITLGGLVVVKSGETITVTRTNFDLNDYSPAVADTTVAIAETTTPEVTAPTTNGGELPNTSTPWGNMVLIGGGLVVAGALGFGSRKVLTK